MNVLWSICSELITLRWLLINSVISIVVYHLVFKNWSYFNENNVKFLRGIPLLGAQWRFFFARESVADSIKRIYNAFSNEKVSGVFDLGSNPIYIIRDPEIIKQIAIKDFDHFMNHRTFGNAEPLLSRSLFTMKDQRWKSMRSNLSPAFTGSKMRLMFSLIGDVSNTFCDHIKNELAKNGEIDCDIRQKFGCFTNDVIASCAFGINIDSMKDENNEFYKIGRTLINFSGLKTTLKFIGMFTVPKLMKFFNITLFDKSTTTFFRQMVKDNMEYREKNSIVRNDMINLLMEMKKGTLADIESEKEVDGDIGFATVQEVSLEKVSGKQKWDDDDLTAQSMIFFVAGFNAVSMTLSFLAYDLAAHPDIQAKLYEEILETQEQLNGKPISYETLQKMKYLDMVLSESIRKWPQAPTNDRVVTKQYELELSDNQKIIFKPGEVIILPTLALHHDAKYFPNPEKFDPERFSDENKDKIIPGTYLPFGIGPRNCIASRFALMECKACIFHLLSNCKIEMSSKMQQPMQLKKGRIAIEPENGFWMKLKSRQ